MVLAPGHGAPSLVLEAARISAAGGHRHRPGGHGHGHRHHGHRQRAHTHHAHHRRVRRHRRGPRAIARALLRTFGWGHRQFRYIDWLWGEESGWDRFAYNPYSGAYGIPQATPGAVMASAGPGWQYNARTQITWGMNYIRARYRSPRQAWAHECALGWY